MSIEVFPARTSVRLSEPLELELLSGCEPPCGCRELNPRPLEEQPVLLTTEPSLQPHRPPAYFDFFSRKFPEETFAPLLLFVSPGS